MYTLFHSVGKGDDGSGGDGGTDGFLYVRKTHASTSFPPHGKFLSLSLSLSFLPRVPSSLISLFSCRLGHTRGENNALLKSGSPVVANLFI